MARTRAILIKSARAGRRDRFVQQFSRLNLSQIRPSVIQFPSVIPSAYGSRHSTTTATTASSTIIASPPESPGPPNSPMDTTPRDEKALIRVFNPNNPMAMFDSIVGDSLVRTLFRHVLGTAADIWPAPSTDDLEPVVHQGQHFYRVRPILANKYRGAAHNLAGIVLCAGNNYNPWFPGAVIPDGIPLENLIEYNVRMPAICLFRVYTQITFEALLFRTIPEALDHIATLQKICRYFVFWIANGIRMSIERGYLGTWKWGSAIGMSDAEFMHRVTPTFHYGGYSELAVYMCNLAEQSDVDFACARLITSNASRLSFTHHQSEKDGSTTSHIAAWPAAFGDNAEEEEMEVDTHIHAGLFCTTTVAPIHFFYLYPSTCRLGGLCDGISFYS
ncbi:hypothetical protein C8J57DRAFT_1308878 [Mycena rebaudengoi]|nr:hypothetical protein C8J57DRAFT_1308878 [Mycena rebaudengoi]